MKLITLFNVFNRGSLFVPARLRVVTKIVLRVFVRLHAEVNYDFCHPPISSQTLSDSQWPTEAPLSPISACLHQAMQCRPDVLLQLDGCLPWLKIGQYSITDLVLDIRDSGGQKRST